MKREYTLVGVNGNAFAIMGYVVRAMKLEHNSKDEIDAYIINAKSSNYTHLIAVSVDMCEKLNNRQP